MKHLLPGGLGFHSKAKEWAVTGGLKHTFCLCVRNSNYFGKQTRHPWPDITRLVKIKRDHCHTVIWATCQNDFCSEELISVTSHFFRLWICIKSIHIKTSALSLFYSRDMIGWMMLQFEECITVTLAFFSLLNFSTEIFTRYLKYC